MSEKPRIRVNATLQKASSEGVPSTVRKGPVGYEGLKLISQKDYKSLIRESKLIDLQFPRSLDTFSEMACDGTVSIALAVKSIMILRAMKGFTIEAGDKEDTESIEAAKFVEWNLKNLSNQTFRSVLENICSYNIYGFSILEKIYSKVDSGEYAGMWKVSKLAPRSQRSLSTTTPWTFTRDGRSITGVNQSRDNLPEYSKPYFHSNEDIEIPRKKVMLFSYQSSNGNPEGKSPCAGVFIPWKEKKLLEELQVVGASKDLGGTPVSRIPIDHLNKAAVDSNSAEAKSLKDMTRDLANLHAGEQTFMLLPSDRDDRGNLLYDVKLMGVEGGGKQFDLPVAIRDRAKTILDNFGAGFMQLGNDGSGSYALMDGKTSVHEAFIENDIDFITSVFHEELFPQLLAMNGIKLPQSKMPVMKAGAVTEESIDEVSKMVQRVFAVNAIPRTPETVNEVLKRCGFKFRLPSDITQEELDELFTDNETKAGAGMEAGMPSGTGTKVGTEGGDSSISNNENGGVNKSAWRIVSSDGGISRISNGTKTIMVMDDDLDDWIGENGGSE